MPDVFSHDHEHDHLGPPGVFGRIQRREELPRRRRERRAPAPARERIGTVSAVPSVSYSITVRLEVPAGGASVSQLTSVVEQAGGAITALDVTASGHERLRIDVTCAARDTDHADVTRRSAGTRRACRV